MTGLNKQITNDAIKMSSNINVNSNISGQASSAPAGMSLGNMDFKRLVSLAEEILDTITQQPVFQEAVLEMDGSKVGRMILPRIIQEKQRLGLNSI